MTEIAASPRGQEGVEICSLHVSGVQEAMRHKWIESERANRDLGEQALQDWARYHWPAYVRARWFEHIQGKRFWKELDRDDFGLLNREFHDQRLLLDRILDRLKAGWENLDVIHWAQDWQLPMEKVIQILEVLDINSRRIAHRFGE